MAENLNETLDRFDSFNDMVTNIIGADSFAVAKPFFQKNEHLAVALYNELSDYLNGYEVRKEAVVKSCLEKMCVGVTEDNADNKLETALQELKDNNPHREEREAAQRLRQQ